MPNGGSDCCGTCPFNRINMQGAPRSQRPGICSIRGELEVEVPFWTYCANHPAHNPSSVRTPIGPVYVHEQGGRVAWMAAEDTPEVRAVLLDVLGKAAPHNARRYPGGYSLTEAAVRHAAEIRLHAAIPFLDGMRRLDDLPDDAERGHFGPEPERLRILARHALANLIEPSGLVPFREVEDCVALARQHADGAPFVRPVLADALIEAGYADEVALDYLRGPPGPGAPCWIVDVLREVEPGD